MATSSLPGLQTALENTIKTVLFDPTPVPAEMQAKIQALAQGIAANIDTYLIDVVSKMTGTTSTSAQPLLTPAVIVPMDGGASLLASMQTNAAVPLSGTISTGGLTTN